MDSQGLFEYVEEQLEHNPVLEPVDSYEDVDERNYKGAPEDVDWELELGKKVQFKEPAEEILDDIHCFMVDKSAVKLTLKEHLLFQLHALELDQKRMLIGEYIIDNIDENGYLTVGIRELASILKVSVLKAGKVLERVQSFDPPGVGARNLRECLIIQLRQMKKEDKSLFNIIENHLDDLAANRINQVAKMTGIDVQKVIEFFNIIRSLDPKPGREFYNIGNVKYIIPDIIIKKISDKFDVALNEEAIPIVNINEYYKRIIMDEVSHETRKFIQNKIDSANWLMKCLQNRRDTIMQVAECILRKQHEFFLKGRKFIKPLLVKTIADEMRIHETIINKAVNDKYLQCTWGIFELRYFFTGRISNDQGEKATGKEIRDMIRELISEEDKETPYSDNEITEILRSNGINTSRSAIARHRNAMDIPASAKRKRKK